MLDFLCNYRCIFCDTLSKRKLDLCLSCERELPFLESCCTQCARPLPDGQSICGSCLSHPKLNLNTTVLFYYQPPIDQLIIDLKFRHNLVGARVLGELMGGYLYTYYQNKPKPELIIPVPLHPLRLRKRGYNQALELSRPIAKSLNIPLNKFSVKRLKHTAPQAKLSAKEREKNIKRAFVVKKSFRYNHVAIVDDVITTGNTIAELCNELFRTGVNKIDVWCCARSNFDLAFPSEFESPLLP